MDVEKPPDDRVPKREIVVWLIVAATMVAAFLLVAWTTGWGDIFWIVLVAGLIFNVSSGVHLFRPGGARSRTR
jgi:hypothetical protein